ncbi:disease resistance protein RGA2-like [Phoenix dactylifera]|uniref:Disease resistance protein RGA2-like n=1 Tax=Phoenix dactylifera TaxID=42345 RepID=A0A8B9A605_PHODC|nr:disease resistance protein RGA2-like [Phoenix dactylifera]XP_038982080.1 disease resistance protein RGA2-like [Phoenix dactylifera]XP_038982081.1 disease resistance protein RGA2-like [Phoenix dactylifera]
MAMILDAFVSKFAEMLVELARQEVDMLLGVPGEIQKLQNKLRMISKVLADAERKRINDLAIEDWLKQLKNFMYDADDILDIHRIEADKWSEPSSSTIVCLFRSRIRRPQEIGMKIRELNQKLEEILRCRSEFNLELTFHDKQQVTSQISRMTSPIGEIDIVGSEIEKHAQSLVDSLIKNDERRNILIFAIVGVGGIGKTTLAQRIYNDQRIQEEFSVKKWVCVSQQFDEINLLKDIIGGAQEHSRSSLEPKVESSLRGKKLFLVLDDVWSAKVWCDLLYNTLNSCVAGSRILVTTRNEQIAMQMLAVNIHHVDKLSLEDSWLLLCNKVVLTGDEVEIQHLKDIGMEIVKKCDGLPLAIRVIAGVLCTKEKTWTAWSRVLESTAWSTSGLPEEVMGALYLSYEDLPSYLKQCFIYCSLFPEDYKLYMCDMTELWIAEGFVKADGSLTVEETAEEYYRELIMRNLLQLSDNDSYICCMHDLLHCLARYLARDESSVVRKVHEVGSSNGPMKLRRVYISNNQTTEIFDVLVKQNSLRTLIWRETCLTVTQMDVVFNKLSRLRVLDICSPAIRGLPDSLGNLIHLRYLDISRSEVSVIPESIGNLRNLWYLNISWTKISMIPKSLENLRNLQLLDMQGCSLLSRLPKCIVNLHNLRSLDLYDTGVVGMPAGLGRLQNLHLLSGFVLQSNRTEGWCTMGELRSLSCLRTLSIDALECISSSSEARAAELRNKSKLRSLELTCTQCPQPNEEEMRGIKEVFEELHPPPCLEELTIRCYFGREFPKWIAETTSSASILFPNLSRLNLVDCNYCERLPPCGLLPHLKYLLIVGAASVIGVGPEFLVSTSTSSNGGGRAGVNASKYAFPKLETLKLNNMYDWQEWHWDKGTQAMPCLKYLFLKECPKLMSLPEGLLLYATSLTKLHINTADRLTTIEKLLSLKELYIRHSRNLEKVSDLPALTTLEVESCPKLQVVENLQSLKRMKLVDEEMKSLPSYLLKGVQRGAKKRKRVHAAHLEELVIRCNMGLVRKICQKASPEWPTIQDIQRVHAYSENRSVHNRRVQVVYSKSPFSFTTNFNDTSSSSSSSGLAL